MQSCDPSAIFGSDVKTAVVVGSLTPAVGTVHIMKPSLCQLACYFQIHSLILQIFAEQLSARHGINYRGHRGK